MRYKSMLTDMSNQIKAKLHITKRTFASVQPVEPSQVPPPSRGPIPSNQTSTINDPTADPSDKVKTFQIYRWNPDEPESKPRMQSFTST